MAGNLLCRVEMTRRTPARQRSLRSRRNCRRKQKAVVLMTEPNALVDVTAALTSTVTMIPTSTPKTTLGSHR